MARIETSVQQGYINRLFAPEDKVLVSMAEALCGTVFEGINLGPAEGRLMQLLIKLIGAKKIVEVGTLMGYSTLWMARVLPEGGKIFTIERNVENHRKARAYFSTLKEKTKVEFVLGQAIEQLNNIAMHGPFDMIFIDADKSGYPGYLDWAEENIRRGGLIIGDNTFLFGQVYGDKSSTVPITDNQVKAMKEFNQRLSDPEKYESILLPTGEGLTIALRK